MIRSRICAFILSVITSLAASAHIFAADLRPMSVDDMMKVEGLGAAASDPEGRWLIFERLRPYELSDDFSFRTYAMGHSGHQLWRYNLKTGSSPELLPGLDPAPHSYLQGFSPDGRFLAIVQYRFGELSLVAYDMSRERAVRFGQTPALSINGSHNPVWISDDELMFAALLEGEWSELTSVRVRTGSILASAWGDAWRGDIVTANEVRTFSRDQSDQQETGRLVRVNARTGESEVVADGRYADLRLSPNRRHLAALSVSKPRPTDPNELAEHDPHRYRLTVFDLETRKARSLAPGLEFHPYTIAWAPDGERIAAYGWPTTDTSQTGRFYVINVQSGAVIRYDHVGLDLVSERERGWLQRPERTVFLGNDLAIFARRIPAGEDQAPRFTFRDVRPDDLSQSDWYALSPNGIHRNLTKDLENVSGVPVHAGDGHLTVVADSGVYRFYSDGQRRHLTPGLAGRFGFLSPGTFATRSGLVRPEFADEAVFDVSSGGAAKIVMVDLRDGHEGEIIVVDAPTADAAPLAGSLAAGAVLFRAQNGPLARLLLATGDQEALPREIARTNAHLEDVNLGIWQVVSYVVEDPEGKQPAQTIHSCVLLPPGYRPAEPPPLIVDVYPNAGPSCRNGTARIDYPRVTSPYLWAGKGYAYARITMPRALIQTADGPIAGMPAVVDAGITALVEKGFADPERLTLLGFSQGGISALYVAAHSQRFKAVIALNSWADLFSHYFGGNGVYSYIHGSYFGNFGRYDSSVGSDFAIGRTPIDDPEVYIRNSPVFLAPKIDTPVLLIHSDMDSFSISQFDEMYGALLRSGKDVRYVRYWGEGHAPSSPANIRDLWGRMSSFLTDSGVTVNETSQWSGDAEDTPAL